MRIIATVEELYRDFKGVAIFHGISPNGAVSPIPDSVTFSERIQYAIDRSKKEMIQGFSIRFNIGSIENRVFGYTGIVIKRGNIFRHFREDSGHTHQTFNEPSVRESNDIEDVINRDGSGYNEFILTDIEPCCIYFYRGTQFPEEQLAEASKYHKLPIRELTEEGLRILRNA
jgi:hypothetical protein